MILATMTHVIPDILPYVYKPKIFIVLPYNLKLYNEMIHNNYKSAPTC